MPIENPIQCASPVASVVIPTLPSRDHSGTVRALGQQNNEEFEVYVVNSNSLDVCEARNTGIKYATGDIVLFTDDDCRPPSDWVGRAIENFSDDELVLLEGPLDRYAPGPRHYTTANLGVAREAAIAIGGFDSRFAGWREDTDFGWRIEEQYGTNRCLHDPSWLMEHPKELQSDPILGNELRFRLLYPERVHTIITTPEQRVKQVYIKLRYQWYSLFGLIYKKINHEPIPPLSVD